MNDILRAMRERALTDAAFRQAILATQNAADPLTALCELAHVCILLILLFMSFLNAT